MPSVLKGPSLILRFDNSLGKSDLFNPVGPSCTISHSQDLVLDLIFFEILEIHPFL